MLQVQRGQLFSLVIYSSFLSQNHFCVYKENEDPRRMHRLIHFLCALIYNKTTLNTINEISCWSLIRNLSHFQWRIPSIWCDINEHAKVLLDHPSEDIRKSIA